MHSTNDPKNVDEGIGLGDVLRYSHLIRQLIALLAGASGVPVGGEVDFPSFKTWLPDGHEWELVLHGKKLR